MYYQEKQAIPVIDYRKYPYFRTLEHFFRHSIQQANELSLTFATD